MSGRDILIAEARRHIVELDQSSLLVDSAPLSRSMKDAAAFLQTRIIPFLQGCPSQAEDDRRSTSSISAARDALDYVACGAVTAEQSDSEDAARFRWLLDRWYDSALEVMLTPLFEDGADIRALIDEYRRA